METIPEPRIVAFRHWPFSLQAIRSAPALGYLWGTFPPGPYVGIVGRRRASAEGRACAFRLARELAQQGVTIVSGGAIGIDAAAHRGALEGGGKTLVMAPVWLSRATPSDNRPLFAQIMEHGGGYFTIADTADLPFDNKLFFRRNEALASLCQVLVVGEHAYRSGARNTAAHAERLRRPLFVLPSLYGNGGGLGSNSLLDRGARVLLNVKDILALLDRQGTYDNPAWWRRPPHQDVREEDSEPGPPCKGATLEKISEHSVGTSQRHGVSGANAQRHGVSGANAQRQDFSASLTPVERRPFRGDIDPTQLEVLESILGGCTTADAICERTKLPTALVQYHLTLLTLGGEIAEDARGLLRLARQSGT